MVFLASSSAGRGADYAAGSFHSHPGPVAIDLARSGPSKRWPFAEASNSDQAKHCSFFGAQEGKKGGAKTSLVGKKQRIPKKKLND